MKGIILAGGKGTRLYPITKAVSKQLLPIYDKPLIYYPLSVLLLAEIREILIISTPEDIDNYKKLLGTGEEIGIKFTYKVQTHPRGLAEAFILGEDFIGEDSVCLVLGDNVFYGQGLTELLMKAKAANKEATIFGYPVNNPKEFGIVEFDKEGKVISIEEKPLEPKSKYAVPGLYFYDNTVIELSKKIKPSERGELEITSLNNEYLRMGRLRCEMMGRGMAWLDTGTARGMLQASQFVETVQTRQGMYVACIEEIAWRHGFIDSTQMRRLGLELEGTEYGKYILSLVQTRD